MNLHKSSVAHVEDWIRNGFSQIIGETHIINKTDWWMSDIDHEVYATLTIEPIFKKTPNNLIILIPPFNTKEFEL